MSRQHRTSSAYFTVVPEKPVQPFPVREIGSDLVVFLDGDTPAVIADCSSADPDSDVRSLRPRAKKLVSEEIGGGEGALYLEIFYSRLGAIFVDKGDHFMICSAQPFKTAADVFSAVSTGGFHLISGFEKSGPGGRAPVKPERRRCPLGHAFMVPPRFCPLHGVLPEPA